MGFMDKAKQMAEQAQQKIDETQKQFNEGQAQKGGGAGDGVRYDSNGRPISESQTPANDPAAAEAVSVPQPPEGVDAPEGEGEQGEVTEQPVPPPAPTKDGMNATPDPFKPIG